MSLQDRRWNIEQCNRCHQCKISPTPRSQKFSAVCPSMEYGQFHAYSGSGKIITGYALMEGRAQYTQAAVDSITTCTMCGACETACQALQGDVVEPLESLYELRSKMYADGQVPAAQRRLLDNITSQGNPFGAPRNQRAGWSEKLQMKDAARESVDVLLHIGCTNAYDQSQWPRLVWIAETLKRAGLSFGTLGNEEGHAGSLAYDLGHQDLARRCGETFAQQLRRSRASTLVTCDAESLTAFRNFYPRLGVTLEPVRVLHITEFLEELGRDGQLPAPVAREEVVTYHDPCRLGRLSEPFVPWEGKWTTVMNGLRVSEPPRPLRAGVGGVYDSPRRLLAQVPGTRLVEMERRREFSYCCGAGGGGLEAHPEFADQAARDRLLEAQATGATTLVTSCATCTRHLRATATRHRMDISVVELVEYLSASSARNPSASTAKDRQHDPVQ